MANLEHLAILKQGVEVWNRWRKENQEIEPDLSDSELIGTDLSGADLSRASLVQADLRGTNLTDAVLCKAVLRDGRLNRALLRRADLSGSDLIQVNLTRASLREADITGVELWETVFGCTDLRGTRGLAACRFRGPCTMDLRTILISWPLPRLFLRGCGLTEDYIEYLPALIGKPLQFHSLFVSYSSRDEDFVGRLYADLQDNGVRCWFAPKDMKIGDKIRDRIDQSIRVYDKLLIVLSENSVQSEWVEDEVESALEKERNEKTVALFPIRLDDASMDSDRAWAAKIRRQRHIGDFREWKNRDSYKTAFERLMRDLKAD